MKLAIVIERLEPWRGGAETSTYEIARLLAARGHDLHVVTATSGVTLPNMTVHHIPSARLLRPLRTAAFIRRAAAFVHAGAFDLVYAVSPMPSADVYQPRGGLMGETLARTVATRTSRPRRMLKQALMAMNVRQRSLLELERGIFRKDGPTILAVSQYVASQCERLYGVVGPRVKVVFNGVNVAPLSAAEREMHRVTVRRQYNVSDRMLLFLFIAHNFRLKGLGPLIETISRLVVAGFVDFKLLVVGRDNPVGYQRQVNHRNLDRFVTFTGPTQRIDLFINAADVLLHPTYYDPCSRVVLEALSRGLPCITTSFNGAAEVMTDGREGFVIDTPDDAGLWARRIEQLAAPELRRSMSERALELRERLSMSRHVDELDAVFAELVHRRTPKTQSA